MSHHHTDPTYRNARKEAIGIGLIWFASMVYCCVYSYIHGYIRADRPLTKDDIAPIWGIPSWVVWGVLVPWIVCSVLTFWYAGFFMSDDDLGKDHAGELESDIREGGSHE